VIFNILNSTVKFNIMAYRDFKIKDLKAKFGIQEIGTKLFDPLKIKKINPSDKLLSDLAEAEYITLSTEKAVSERLVAPVLVEIAKLNEELQVFSGEIIVADKANGLNGELDFVFARKPWTRKPENPLLCVTESKLGLINSGVDQATAQMLGLRIFNHNNGHDEDIIHGAVTDGTSWRFLKLKGNDLLLDLHVYSTENLPLLLGVLQEIINFYKK
jgi:hypothetical protein